MRLALQVYGAGRTGLAVARLARDRGLAVTAWNRSPLDERRARLADGLPTAIGGAPQPMPADVWLLAVSDDAIGEVAEELARALEPGFPRPRVAAHCAGARTAEELAPLAAKGVPCGSWHPAMTFRGAASDPAALADARVVVEGDPTALGALDAFCRALGIGWYAVAGRDKPRYHSALVLAANGRVALAAAAESLLGEAGLDAAAARGILAPLLARTDENLHEAGPAAALTGPVARGDAATVRVQLEALRGRPELRRLYRALAAIELRLVPGSERGPGHRAVAELIEAEEAPAEW